MFDEVLAGYAEFLNNKDMVRPAHVPHFVRWVGDFLSFAREERREGRGADFEETLTRFL